MSTTTAEALDLAKTGGSHPGRFFTDVAGVDPIRAELFGLEHLQGHACELAQASPVMPAIKAGHPLLARFIQNGRRLVEAHRRITEATRRLESITPDAEWLLDNFHIVSDALREIRIDLPGGYYRKLPKLAGGPLAGFPRVYTLALELIAHTDSTIDETNITRFVQSYQTVRPLSIGELWAVPIMLRLGLVENLRRLSDQMLKAWSHRGQAQACCEQLVANKERLGPDGPTVALASVLPPRAHWSDPFVVWLLQGIRDSGPDASPLIEWLESHLIGTDYHPVEVLRREHQRQAANQVSVGNCVTSLRLLSALDWNVLFERMSLVEAVLKDDPAGAYARQDFATKDRYRRIVERLARGSKRDELSVARATLALSRRQQARPQHVGEYLIGRGRRELERDIGYRPRIRDRLLRGVLEHARLVYFGALAATFALFLAGFLSLGNGGSWAVTLALGVLLLLPVTELSVGIIHHVLTMFIPPRVLPKLDLKDGIPADWATFVVMPTMLIRPDSAAGLADRLEVHYLSNPEPHLYFALLTDFADAPTETMPEDQEYLLAARERIKALNERYCAGGANRFFLFHRRRVWNPVQGCWMGWERKRGKLQEFNRLLRGARDTSFVAVNGAFMSSPRIRYVITLDADTQLPREAARRLIGTLAHPLNQARIDPDQGRVIDGYGVLQPRVSLSLVAATRSLFARILTSSAGIDPYTTAVSDVYQDLFGIGSFTGKGIYDIDAFEMSAGRAFPENHILSHDLIEGNYARCGLVTDIELLDDFPSRYHAYALREHRWIRGDWQLLPWLSPQVPVPNQHSERGSSEPVGRGIKRANPLPWVERWKVFDNLRRSLVPPSLVGLLVAGWVLPGLSAWVWTAIALSVPGLPVLLVLIDSIRGLPSSGSWQLKLRDVADRLRSTCAQFLMNLIFLVEQARLALDAVVRTLARLLIRRRNLLEWETAAATERRLGNDLLSFCLTMWVPPVFALGVAVLLAAVHPEALLPASAVLIAWLLSPAVAFWVSRPRPPAEDHLTLEQDAELRRFARKTWSFFERFVGSEDHWLPPDNYQEDPKSAVAHRTSPTNIGLCLISNLAAHDLGYLSLSALGDRLEQTFDTLDRLERMHGHFYNWYDTITLRPLQPGYISTVDSGNLLACLLTLKEGLREKVETAVVGVPQRQGLADTLNLVKEELRDIDPPTVPEQLEIFQSLNAAADELTRRLDAEAPDLYGWRQCLLRLNEPALQVVKGVQQLAGMLHEKPEDLERWATRLAEQVGQHLEELEGLAPWLGMIAELDAESNEPGAKNPGASPNAAWRKQWPTLRTRLLRPESIGDLQTEIQAALAELAESEKKEAGREAPDSNHEPSPCLARLAAALESSTAGELIARCHRLADRAHRLAADMDFKLLYNEQRHLFSIGFNLAHNRLDNAHYDLLASEACLASFLAIARGDAPKRHWFHLGRPLTRAAGKFALLSWGGTMFEYLMPRLFLRTYDGTLLDESCRSAVDLQIDYGRQHRVPWGISESAFSALDASLNYQYQAFGVPGLGLKRGLADNLVIAPYAAALALAVCPGAALENLRALRRERGEGPFGFYEALDYTRDRRVEKRRPALVRSYMAHHQGMSLIALANCLCGNPMVRRCHSEAMVRATELLLQERMPRNAPLVNPPHEEAPPTPAARERPYPMSRVVSTPHTAHPRTHLLSNGSYHVMVTNAGAGYATWRDLDVTRWREDRTRDCWGQFVYVRNLRQGLVWSAGYQPLGRSADRYEVVFSNDKAELRRTDAGIETHLEITVSPENPAEVRRLTITNHNLRVQELEVTSYAEIVLGAHSGDLAHPAFAKLFLETEYLPADSALLCRRRPRAADQKPIWAVHVLAVDAPTVGDVQFETDRCRFLGRGRTPANPQALEPNIALSGTTGAVLDPIFSLRQRLRVEPGASVNVAFTTGVAESREDALALVDQYHDFHGVNRAFELAWAHSQVQLQHLRLSPGETHLYQRLAAHILYPGSALRSPGALTANRQGQPALWRHGISGDHPIVLVRIAEPEELALVRQLLLAHAYWRLKGLVVDLVILNDHPASYLEELHEQIQNLVRVSESHTLIDKPGGVFVRRSAQLSEDDKILLQAAAVVVLLASRGALEAQIERSERSVALPARLAPTERKKEVSGKTLVDEAKPSAPSLSFPNGFGGFSADGREYWVLPYGGRSQPSTPSRPSIVPPGTPRSNAAKRDRVEIQTLTLPPAPWINVVANPSFGFLVSETGGGYTWFGNSQSNRLTPWRNDPVTDSPCEVLYLRDERSGEYWTPAPFLLGSEKGNTRGEPAAGPVTTGSVRHGQGYTIFERTSNGLSQQLLLFVPVNDPIKIYRLKVRNLGSETRQLSATFFCEWVLGTVRDQAGRHLIPQFDSESDALLARNAFNIDFGNRLAFAAVNRRPRTFTADRTEFLGRNGSVAAPAALSRVTLSGRVEPATDVCAAFMAPFDLRPGEEREIVFFLGQAADLDEVRRLLRRYRDPGQVQTAFDEVCKHWDRILSAVQVRTPDPAIDLLLNRWLLYQVLSCRVWARSAFYQSGGAYGFRDQLQDVMALVYSAAEAARAQILRAAARQFLEGDVQHWWHPPSCRGVRTRFSDDFLWLPFVTCHFVDKTGDLGILDERQPFLRAPVLKPEQEEDYGLPEVTAESATLYDHCVRAIDNGMHFGAHGLPLMGTGDWNDGMNRVGAGGKGESVWDAWFLLTILRQFADLAERRHDSERASRYREQAERLRTSIEEHGWDGRWYRRAFFDDGTPLGSQQNDECTIDSLTQTWAVISDAAQPERARQAMEAVAEMLVRPADKLILLFTPPFDKGRLHPGYIKGYVPGIRENGGQYTHAATWVVQATALLGQGSKAVKLFNLLNPVHHASSPEDIARYRVEPYVVAADVYSQPPHTGRGGWTWYTGSAGWLYRVGLENILGFQLKGGKLHIKPAIPSAWPGYEITYRHRSAVYRIKVENPHQVEQGVQSVTVDGQVQANGWIDLADDGKSHEVRVVLGTHPGVESEPDKSVSEKKS